MHHARRCAALAVIVLCTLLLGWSLTLQRLVPNEPLEPMLDDHHPTAQPWHQKLDPDLPKRLRSAGQTLSRPDLSFADERFPKTSGTGSTCKLHLPSRIAAAASRMYDPNACQLEPYESLDELQTVLDRALVSVCGPLVRLELGQVAALPSIERPGYVFRHLSELDAALLKAYQHHVLLLPWATTQFTGPALDLAWSVPLGWTTQPRVLNAEFALLLRSSNSTPRVIDPRGQALRQHMATPQLRQGWITSEAAVLAISLRRVLHFSVWHALRQADLGLPVQPVLRLLISPDVVRQYLHEAGLGVLHAFTSTPWPSLDLQPGMSFPIPRLDVRDQPVEHEFVPQDAGLLERCTMIMTIYERHAELPRFLAFYHTASCLHKIVVIWNCIQEPVPKLNWTQYAVPVVLRRPTRNSLNNRFRPDLAIETDCVINMDDDWLMPHQVFTMNARVWWHGHRDRLIGLTYLARLHGRAFANGTGPWMYLKHKERPQSMVLPSGFVSEAQPCLGACHPQTFHHAGLAANNDHTYHRRYLQAYTTDLPAAARDGVDMLMNCDDLLFNLLVASRTGHPPILVDSSGVAGAKVDAKLGKAAGLWRRSSHMDVRHRCLNELLRFFGDHMPLRYTTLTYGVELNIARPIPRRGAEFLPPFGCVRSGSGCKDDCVECTELA
ncbi:uncharacterized protein MONBRDRAFT_25145 [Monosiga brevicollis MX1]|uniref:Glycosyl transferase 64 domain-containing protein n=1 Tax=Monosiga brevicollis TaxID=81824 RepID=A9UYJ4_MONBE|nr:uncharacterized protein MONBRDRAFT_25145 [Monosiga brevicollis MX1]EDQ89472.1 predicted protein [Monosiga brevicollis MX1]|eukprot:XP_001745501.1 hypothetical protein [Monosiga brevicollis MX1]